MYVSCLDFEKYILKNQEITKIFASSPNIGCLVTKDNGNVNQEERAILFHLKLPRKSNL